MTGTRRQPIWMAEAAAEATNGVTSGDWQASGVSIDTRTLREGDLFIALSGPNFDGHDYVLSALENGGAAAVVQADKAPGFRSTSPNSSLLEVADTMAALEDLGRAARQRSSARIIAVTGSVGKTGTKEALKLAFGTQGRVSATEGNLNNHFGLPLSLARMPENTEFGIFEMGMNHPGEIAPLSSMARPDVAVITEIAEVHSEYFDGLAQISDAKAEIYTGMGATGIAVLNLDSMQFERLADQARGQGVGRIITFGQHGDADMRLLGIDRRSNGSAVRAACFGDEIEYRIGVAGGHWVLNSLGVLGAVYAAGADVEKAAAALADMRGLKGRGQRHEVTYAEGTFVLIDESYNASPTSMTAAIEVLGQGEVVAGGRRIAVLGDMLELGNRSEELHAELAGVLDANGIDQVFTAGQFMSALWDLLPAEVRGGHACAAKKLAPIVTAAVAPGDLVMVKGSLGSQTRVIVDALLSLGTQATGDTRQVVNGK